VAWLGELDAAGRLSVKAAATWNFTYQKGLFEEEVRSEWVELTEGCYLWEPEYHKRAYMQLFGIFTTRCKQRRLNIRAVNDGACVICYQQTVADTARWAVSMNGV
jgi:hypothetical protein